MAASIETRENEYVEILQTHYFKGSYEQVKEAYLAHLDSIGFNVISVDETYFEIFAEIPRMTVTAKIIQQNPRETSIDFYVDADFLFGSKRKCMTFI